METDALRARLALGADAAATGSAGRWEVCWEGWWGGPPFLGGGGGGGGFFLGGGGGGGGFLLFVPGG